MRKTLDVKLRSLANHEEAAPLPGLCTKKRNLVQGQGEEGSDQVPTGIECQPNNCPGALRAASAMAG